MWSNLHISRFVRRLYTLIMQCTPTRSVKICINSFTFVLGHIVKYWIRLMIHVFSVFTFYWRIIFICSIAHFADPIPMSSLEECLGYHGEHMFCRFAIV